METIKKTLLIITLCLMLTSCKTNYIPIITTNNITNGGGSSGLWYNNSGTIQNNDSLPVNINADFTVSGGGSISATSNDLLTPHQFGNTVFNSELGDTVTIYGSVYHIGDLLHSGKVVQGETSISTTEDLALSVNHDVWFKRNLQVDYDLDGAHICDSDDNICLNETQKRVEGTCSSGSSIRIINSDGSVTCETDSTGDNNYVTAISITENDEVQNISLTRNGLSTLWATFNDNNSGGGGSSLWINESGTATYYDNVKSGYVDSYKGIDSLGTGSTAHGYSECQIPFLCDLGGAYGVNTINSTGKGSFASGYAYGFNAYEILASGDGCTALGSTVSGSLICSGEGSIAVGSETTVSSDTAGSFGRKNHVSGVSAFAFGYDNVITGSYGLAYGWGNDISGGFASAGLGAFNNITSDTAGAIGSFNTMTHNGAYALGIQLESDAIDTVYVGAENNFLRIDNTTITLNSTLNTGSNEGTNLCIDANNNLCTCGSCA